MTSLGDIRVGLSVRLLILTVIFVLLAEAFIYVPSIARYRQVYLEDHMETAHLAALALEAAPDNMVGKELEDRLLAHAKAYGVVLIEENRRMLALSSDMPPQTDIDVNISAETWRDLIWGAFDTMGQTENRVMRVIGPSPRNEAIQIEVILDEAPLRMEMLDYSRRILNLSLVISLITAVLIYVSLHWMMVRPVRRLVKNMADFRMRPEDDASTIVPSARRDEIGLAEDELLSMQGELRKMLRQKDRLAAIGVAAAKINHDLRNSLAKSMLISDQLAGSTDEKVRKLAPQLSHTVDQAIDLCSQTMNYVSNSRPHLEKELFYMRDLVEEVSCQLEDLMERECELVNQVDDLSEVEGDVTQLRRVIANLVRNAIQMGAKTVSVSMEQDDAAGFCHIDIVDDGPGLPQKARDNLFKPFDGSARRGGTGLGLVIARDILRAHDGDLTLIHTGEKGTCFRLSLPVMAV